MTRALGIDVGASGARPAIVDATNAVVAFGVAISARGTGTGGARFARFPGLGEPRNVFDKLDDCATIHPLVRATPTISLHFPWDSTSDYPALREAAEARGLAFDAVNSNTLPESAQPEALLQVRLAEPCRSRGARTGDRSQCRVHRNRPQARLEGAHRVGRRRFELRRPIQHDARARSLPRLYARGLQRPAWRLAGVHRTQVIRAGLYSTVISDWGTSFAAAQELGPKALRLVDLGRHAPNVNIEQIVARLVRFKKLAGFHFNDSKDGDDDLDAGSVEPFRVFLVFDELVDAQMRKPDSFAPAYMLDQSHNVTDPIESLMQSAIELQRAYAQALIVDREALSAAQAASDALGAHLELKRAFTADVSPILAMARLRAGGAIAPIEVYRASG